MMIDRILAAVARRLPCRTIEHYGDVYLARYRVLSLGRLLRVYLHDIRRPDSDEEHHSHPWVAALAVPLVLGYIEERLHEDGRVTTHERAPWRPYLLQRSTHHRIARFRGNGPCWTLFIPLGRNSGEWYFKHPVTGEITPWRVFVERQSLRSITVGSRIETEWGEAVAIGFTDGGWVRYRYEATRHMDGATIWVENADPPERVTWLGEADAVSEYVLKLRGAYGCGIANDEPPPKSSAEIRSAE